MLSAVKPLAFESNLGNSRSGIRVFSSFYKLSVQLLSSNLRFHLRK